MPTNYALVGGPLCGQVLTFPEGFRAKTVELWCRGLKYEYGDDFFVRYTLRDGRYHYADWGKMSAPAEWSEEAYPEVFCTIKGVGKQAVWRLSTELTS